jgi:hypothetical protein
MNKEFIPYEQALELKKLGYNELCGAFYEKDLGSIYQHYAGFDIRNDDVYYNDYKLECTAPLYQQAFRWFREKYRLYPEIIYSARDKKWVCQTSDCIGFELLGWYQTYEEAELECLKKLIEIAKDKPQKQGRIQDISIG